MGRGITEYEHLVEVCNLEEGVIRAYVGLGNKVEGHPVSVDVRFVCFFCACCFCIQEN